MSAASLGHGCWACTVAAWIGAVGLVTEWAGCGPEAGKNEKATDNRV
jgi:hypothetical protein